MSSKVYETDILKINNNFIFMKVKSNFNCFILSVMYVPSDVDIVEFLDEINVSFNHICSRYPGLPWVVGGDFNARLANLNQLKSDILNINSIFTAERISRDKTTNSRGRTLVEFMESSNFVLLNGRSPSDTPANFTFTGAQGHSVIDQVWCSCDEGLSLFCDLQVLQLPTLSDHLSVTVLFADHYSGVYQPDGDDGLRFDIFRAEAFTHAMEWSGEVSHLNGDVDELNSTLTSTIKNVAKNLGMTRPPRHDRLISNNKPWFDRDCRDAKRRVFLKLKRAKADNFSKESKLNFLK